MNTGAKKRVFGGNDTVNMTEGNPVRLLIAFSIPMLIGNIFQQLYNLVDSVVIGRVVGGVAFGAVGETSSLNFLFFAICNGIGSGGGIITAQYFGKGDDDKVRKCITNTAYLMGIFPLIVGTAAYFLVEPLLILTQVKEEFMADAVLYAKMMCIGLILVSLYNFVSSMLRALGDSKTPLYFLIFASILNTVLDVVFVKYLNLAVFGAALATLIAQFVSGVASLIYAILFNPYFKLKKEDFKPDFKIIKSAVKIGIPLSLQFSLIAISCMALQTVVNTFDNWVAVAAFTATSRIEQIVHQPYQTLSAALSTYSGQNYGAKKYKRLIDGYRKSLLMMFIFTVVMLPVMQFGGKWIMAVFVKEPEVIEMGITALRITSIFYIFLGVIYVVRGVLNGIGDAAFALINGIVEVVGRFTVPLLLISIPLFGIWGIWWSVGAVWFVSGLTAWLRYIAVRKKQLSFDKEA